MNIAIMGVITKPISQNTFGGTEKFTYLLVKGLVERGHNITLYCAKGSKTDAQKHVYIVEPEIAMSENSNVQFVYPYTLAQIRRLINDTKKISYDLIHINAIKSFMMSFFSAEFNLPLIHTIHRDYLIHQQFVNMYKALGISKNEYFVFVSKNACKKNKLPNTIKTSFIHNGIDPTEYPFNEKPSLASYLWLSRIDELKGPDVAIKAAKAANVGVILSGDIDREKYQNFFNNKIKPYLDEKRIFENAKNLKRKVFLYQNSKAFLFPIQWEEPFGLVVVESLSSGTPVIAFDRGAMKEIVQHKRTGYLVKPNEGVNGIVKGIRFIESLPKEKYFEMRKNCRLSILNNFTYKIMAQKYEQFYSKIINQ